MKHIKNHNGFQSGFTLIEMLIVVVIIAILSAIAIPSYQKQIRKNAESSAITRMKSLDLELERWRASSLSYRGFIPQKSTTDYNTGDVVLSYAYDVGDKVIYIPEGSTATDYKYMITLDDGTTGGRSLTTTNATIGESTATAVGSQWRMIAVPNDTKPNLERAEKYLLTSSGVQCKTPLSSVTFASTSTDKANCSQSGVEKW